MRHHRILFIDAYDSFSNNIVALLEEQLPVTVDTIKLDDPRFVLNDDDFYDYLDDFDAVVAGPGPGHPVKDSDVGLISRLWRLPHDHVLPVLGICLGFQSLALEFRATVERLKEPRHGFVTAVLHCGSDIFKNAGSILATQYHSLHVKLGHSLTCTNLEELWRPSRICKELLPLAWDLSDAINGPVLASLRHCHLPFWGVQYHPESICTNGEGQKLVSNWWTAACAWRDTHHRTKASPVKGFGRVDGQTLASLRVDSPIERNTVQWTSLALPNGIEVTDVVCMLRGSPDAPEPILLESGLRNGNPVNPETGRFSIVGLPDARSVHIRYSASSHQLQVVCGGEVLISRNATITDTFTFIEHFLQEHKVDAGPGDVPFWGGLVGFISYEAGLESIDVPDLDTKERPDVWFVFIERSIVVDHISKIAYVQSIREYDHEWLRSVQKALCEHRHSGKTVPNDCHGFDAASIVISPNAEGYRRKVMECQEHLRAGSSYELCLTDRTVITSEIEPWSLFMRLRKLNPAPFGAYLHFSADQLDSSSISLASSSPERFLSWSRDGICQFRPIKGTVKKDPDMTRTKAEQMLSSPKEQAENLMIVDLIRHDLNGVLGAYNVRVPKLMTVEEYETVFQLVSVVEGDLVGSGAAILAASLPPGSMTGAPKKRSCDLLKAIEGGKARGLYSGVVGYLDVGGGGDFSVVIRSAFKWQGDDWCIGAGGAVTSLSDPEAEWQEMLAKRENVLRAFM